MKVKVRNGKVESALRVFKRKSADRIWEVRQREFYTPKREQRRLAKKAAIARTKREQRENKFPKS
jgi:ribosomal protein S21